MTKNIQRIVKQEKLRCNANKKQMFSLLKVFLDHCDETWMKCGTVTLASTVQLLKLWLGVTVTP